MIDVIDLFDKQLIQDNEKRRDNYIYSSHHPSSYTKCMRQTWYKWMKHPVSNPETAASLIRLGMGNANHYWIQSVFFKMFPAMKEVMVYKEIPELEYPIRGYIDNVFCMPKEQAVFGAEFKTSYGAGIKHIQTTGMPREDAMNQVFLYLSLPIINPSLPDYLTDFYVFYLGRDDAYRTGFWLKRNGKDYFVGDKLIDWDVSKIIPRFQLLEKHLKENTLPDKEFKLEFKTRKGEVSINKAQTDWQCLYCSYMDKCHGIENEYNLGGD